MGDLPPANTCVFWSGGRIDAPGLVSDSIHVGGKCQPYIRHGRSAARAQLASPPIRCMHEQATLAELCFSFTPGGPLLHDLRSQRIYQRRGVGPGRHRSSRKYPHVEPSFLELHPMTRRARQHLPGPTYGSSAWVVQSPSGFTFKFARAAAAPPAPAAPACAGARLAAARSALRRSCRDGI